MRRKKDFGFADADLDKALPTFSEVSSSVLRFGFLEITSDPGQLALKKAALDGEIRAFKIAVPDRITSEMTMKFFAGRIVAFSVEQGRISFDMQLEGNVVEG